MIQGRIYSPCVLIMHEPSFSFLYHTSRSRSPVIPRWFNTSKRYFTGTSANGQDKCNSLSTHVSNISLCRADIFPVPHNFFTLTPYMRFTADYLVSASIKYGHHTHLWINPEQLQSLSYRLRMLRSTVTGHTGQLRDLLSRNISFLFGSSTKINKEDKIDKKTTKNVPEPDADSSKSEHHTVRVPDVEELDFPESELEICAGELGRSSDDLVPYLKRLTEIRLYNISQLSEPKWLMDLLYLRLQDVKDNPSSENAYQDQIENILNKYCPILASEKANDTAKQCSESVQEEMASDCEDTAAILEHADVNTVTVLQKGIMCNAEATESCSKSERREVKPDPFEKEITFADLWISD